MLLVWGDLWAVYERGRVWCLIVRETCEYHSRGEEYLVLFWRDLQCGYHSKLDRYGVCPGEACLCQLLTDHLLRVMIYWAILYKSALCLPKTMSCLS